MKVSMITDIDVAMEQLDLGKLKWKPDADLLRYRRGMRLTLGELRGSSDDRVVWVYYKEHNEHEPRINGAMRMMRVSDDCWSLSDGSSFVEHFDTNRKRDENGRVIDALGDYAAAVQDCAGEGNMTLYEAVRKP